MTQNQNEILDDVSFNKPTVPTFLKVLTVLTFIGCALVIIGSIWTFATAKKNYDNMEQTLAQVNKPSTPAFARKMMGSPEEFRAMTTISYQKRVPIMLTGLIGGILCLLGAIQMRSLKKQGFTVYTVGELMGLVTAPILYGATILKSGMYIFSAVVAIAFIIMYALNRKYMIN